MTTSDTPAKSPKMLTCPREPKPLGWTGLTAIGCGKPVPDVRDAQGYVDCPNCGMFWQPEPDEGNAP